MEINESLSNIKSNSISKELKKKPNLNDSVLSVKGIGEDSAKLLERLSIYTIWDLITYFPKKFFDFKTNNKVIDEIDQNQLVLLKVVNKEYKGRNGSILTIFCQDSENNFIELLCFNRNFYEQYAIAGSNIYVFGKFKRKMYSSHFVSSSFKIISEKVAEEFDFFPNYRLTKGLTTFILARFIKSALLQYKEILHEILPFSLIEKYKFPPFYEIVYTLHFPKNLELFEKARRIYAYYEFFIYMVKISLFKKKYKDKVEPRNNISGKLQKEFIEKLPFILTEDQLKAIEELNLEYKNKYLINTLIHGDVGSGKTIVSFSFLLNYIEAGYQAAFMAPTEILAKQHYNNFLKLCPEIKSSFLSSSLKKSEKEKIYHDLESGKIKVIFGTHSIITDNVKFNNLKIAIIDEQQQFGVNQRLKLRQKGKDVDLLVLSATPIPRTVYLTLYGDLNIITIKQLPKNRKQVKTYFFFDYESNKLVELIEKELSIGNSGFFVYPVIEEDNELELKSAKEMFEKIKGLFNKYKVELIHGQMKDDEIDKIMNDFKEKKFQILVSTTIIAVGIDIPHSTFIVIEESQRFGLSTLHQLRGRVGRNDKPSICILTCPKNISDIARKRVNKLCETTDGFEIAEFDLKLRGPGEVFGTKQSGEINFKLADFVKDHNIFKYAFEDAKQIVEKDPLLQTEENLYLRNYLKDIENVTEVFLLSG
jgi:ATP-dependent DNA helicase RecG